MRKAGILLVCLLVIGIAGLVPVGNYLSAEKGNIQLTEHILYGDKAVAEGVQITFGSRLQWQHYWDSVYTIGTNPEIETQYTYYPTGNVENSTNRTYKGITFGGFPNYGSSGKGLPLESMVSPDEFLPAYQQLVDATPNGTSGFEIIRVEEYFTFYPVWPNIETEYFWYDISGPYGYMGHLGSGATVDESNQKALYDALNAYFRIPVLSNDIYLISVTKNEDGTVTDVSGKPGYPDRFAADTFQWNLVSTYDEEAIYFTFVPYSPYGVEMDTALIPGGFGVYRLPYEKDEDGIYHVKEKELETVCALDPAKVKEELHLQIEETGTLRVITGDEENVYFYAFDMETWECRQELLVARQGEERMTMEYEAEDFMVCSFGTDSLVVIESRQDGTYELKCRIPIEEDSPMKNLVYGYDGRVSYDWNGKQLAYVVTGMADAGEVYLGYQDFADFHVGICDETGLLYLADYLSSLHAAKERLPEYRYSGIQCQTRHSVLAVEWGK